MKRLILMRHAKSDWSAAGDDFSRPLNKRGVKSAPVMGHWLRDLSWVPTSILCSSSVRTRQTLDLLEFADVPTRYEKSLYLAEAAEISATVQSADGDIVLVIGHNHGIAECAHNLVADWPSHPRFGDYPTCATSLISFEIDDWIALAPGTGYCEHFAVPKDILSDQTPD